MVLVNANGARKLFTTGSTQLGLHPTRRVLCTAPCQLHKGPGVAVRTILSMQLYLFTLDAQQGSSFQRGMQNRQRAAQCATRMWLICIRPEQGRQGIALVGLPGDGQVSEKGDGFAGVKCDGGAVQYNTGGAE